MSTLRYWLVLSLMFLAELFLDQVSLSPGCSVLKLIFLVWCVLPIDNNGTLLIYENVRKYFALYKHKITDFVLGFATSFQNIFWCCKWCYEKQDPRGDNWDIPRDGQKFCQLYFEIIKTKTWANISWENLCVSEGSYPVIVSRGGEKT